MADEINTPEGGGDLGEIKAALAKLAPLLQDLDKIKALIAGAAPAAVEEEVIDEDEAAKAAAAAIDEKNQISAMDASIKTLTRSVASLTKTVGDRFAAMDSAGNVAESIVQNIAKRDALAARLTPHIGTFDHADKTLEQVAAYGLEKLGVTGVTKGGETVALDAYLHNRPAPRAVAHAADSSDATVAKSVASFLSGE